PFLTKSLLTARCQEPSTSATPLLTPPCQGFRRIVPSRRRQSLRRTQEQPERVGDDHVTFYSARPMQDTFATRFFGAAFRHPRSRRLCLESAPAPPPLAQHRKAPARIERPYTQGHRH